jgi:hypothetical protein
MKVNETPLYDTSDNPTACCPRFKPAEWDGQEFHFSEKLFARAVTRSLLYVPINMSSVFRRVHAAIEAAGAKSDRGFLVLSRDLSPWTSEHYFAVTHEVPGLEMRRLSGDFLTKVFEGPYSRAPAWMKELASAVTARGKNIGKTFFFYTTCPRCAKHYGENYVVGVAEAC